MQRLTNLMIIDLALTLKDTTASLFPSWCVITLLSQTMRSQLFLYFLLVGTATSITAARTANVYEDSSISLIRHGSGPMLSYLEYEDITRQVIETRMGITKA